MSIDKEFLNELLGIELQTPTVEQKRMLSDRYHSSACYSLQYAKVDEGSNHLYVFAMPQKVFGSWEYYFGMEYERGNIEAKAQMFGEVIVAYNNKAGRAIEVWNMLTGSEDEEREENEWDE